MPTITFNNCREPVYSPGSPSTRGSVTHPVWGEKGVVCADSRAVSQQIKLSTSSFGPGPENVNICSLCCPCPGSQAGWGAQLSASAHTQPSLLEHHHHTHGGDTSGAATSSSRARCFCRVKKSGGKEIVTQIWQPPVYNISAHLQPHSSSLGGSCSCCCCCTLYQPQQRVGLLSAVCQAEIDWFSQAPLPASCPQAAVTASPSLLVRAETSRARSKTPAVNRAA